MKYKAIPCPCGHPVCKNWLVEPVAALQGVSFTEAQARLTADVLNIFEEDFRRPDKPLDSDWLTDALRALARKDRLS